VKKFILAALGAAALVLPSTASSQELPLKGGDFWDVGAVTVDDGHFGDYADFLAGQFRKNMEFQKSKGWIKGYHILANVNARDGEPDLYLVTIFDHVTTPAEDIAREKEANAFLADASAELGEYKSAEDAVQWMLDMRPGNLSGLTRAAYLREVFGDVDGAIDLYTTVFDRMSPLEIEDRAWILSQVGHLYLSIGKTPEAGQALEQALKLMPDYHYALGYLAKVRLAENRPANAVTLLRRLCEVAPHAENLYALAEALHRLGSAQAGTVYADFEQNQLASATAAVLINSERAALKPST